MNQPTINIAVVNIATINKATNAIAMIKDPTIVIETIGTTIALNIEHRLILHSWGRVS